MGYGYYYATHGDRLLRFKGEMARDMYVIEHPEATIITRNHASGVMKIMEYDHPYWEKADFRMWVYRDRLA